MHKRLICLLGLFLACALFSQELVRNPGKPLNRDAGRVLQLEPVFEIRDDSGEFFFKFPYRFDIDSRGCLYVLDQAQLMKFSPEGKFVGNLLKKGQGPGEIATRFQMISFFTKGGRPLHLRWDRKDRPPRRQREAPRRSPASGRELL